MDDPVEALRHALAVRDVEEASRRLADLPVAVPVLGGQVATTRDAGGRTLPLFLTHASWEAFDFPGDRVLVSPSELLEVLDAVAPDRVLFDPALASAITLPVEDVRALLRGELPRADGSASIVRPSEAVPDDELRSRVLAAVAQAGEAELAGRVWAMRRTRGDELVPLVALASDAVGSADALAQILRGADLPHDLELTVLDEATTDLAERTWTELRLLPAPQP
ncbi:hypothetical protein [Cellulomonas sp. URHD0024]|uniref:hypothetical protein n=1 Tax=Cellulomonas sp. URHD0024 TaxID=1302620 RepID=UPI0003F8DC7D|nr:hypothetical protein [Cellulomonas sp. URHD0024]